MKTIDSALQTQIDAQLLEQGAFTPLELLIDSGRLQYADYERWRRTEVEWLDDVLMGSREKIHAELNEAVGYACGIGLVEQTQEFAAWVANGGARPADRPLRISSDAQLNRLIGARFVPAQSAPQMDLFFDNPVVAVTSGIVRALSAHDLAEAQRLVNRLYAQAPNHADLAAFDSLLTALSHLGCSIDEPRLEVDFLLEISPIAKRLLGSHSRDLLTPLWRQLSGALNGRQFSPDEPTLHATFVLTQAHDWPGVSDAVLNEPAWQSHAALCLRLAESAFYRGRRSEALAAWCHLCWRVPAVATLMLEQRRTPDSGVTGLWRRFVEAAEELAPPDEEPLGAADFPAWLLLHEPGLAQQLAADLPTGGTRGERHYRCVHEWIHARRAGHHEEELGLRKALQAGCPALFRYLKKKI